MNIIELLMNKQKLLMSQAVIILKVKEYNILKAQIFNN